MKLKQNLDNYCMFNYLTAKFYYFLPNNSHYFFELYFEATVRKCTLIICHNQMPIPFFTAIS